MTGAAALSDARPRGGAALLFASMYTSLVVIGAVAAVGLGVRAWLQRRALPSWVRDAERLGFRRLNSSPITVARDGTPRCQIGAPYITSGDVYHHDATKLEISFELPVSLGAVGSAVVERGARPWTRVDAHDDAACRALLERIEPVAAKLARDYGIEIISRWGTVRGSYTTVAIITDATISRDDLRAAIAAGERLAADVTRGMQIS